MELCKFSAAFDQLCATGRAPCWHCLQEGAGHAVMSAYVEVVFDNSDNRLPVSLWDTLASSSALRSAPDTLQGAVVQKCGAF